MSSPLYTSEEETFIQRTNLTGVWILTHSGVSAECRENREIGDC